MSVLDYDGKATWNLINLPVGTYPVFAVYNGNENYTFFSQSTVHIVKDHHEVLMTIKCSRKQLQNTVTVFV